MDSNFLIKFQLRHLHFFLFSIIVLVGETILFFASEALAVHSRRAAVLGFRDEMSEMVS